MNDQKSNKHLEPHPCVFRFTAEPKSISLNVQQYSDLKEKIDNHIDLLERIPKITSVSEFKDIFQSGILEEPSLISFYSLDDKTKTFISMIHISTKYLRYLVELDFSAYADVLREYPYNPDTFNKYLIDITNHLNVVRELSKDPRHRPTKVKLIKEKDLEQQGSFGHDSKDSSQIITQKSSGLDRNLSNRFSHPLQIVFNHIVSIKHSFLFLLEQFYRIIGSVKHLNFDDKTYNQIYNSVTEEDYDSFRPIIDDWNRETVNELADIVELFYPTLIYVETITTNQIFEYISKDLYSKDSPLKFEFSFVGVILIILVNYILNRYIANHLDYYEKETLMGTFEQSYSFFNKYSAYVSSVLDGENSNSNIIDWPYYINWIVNGTEAIIDFFNNDWIDQYITRSEEKRIENERQSKEEPLVDDSNLASLMSDNQDPNKLNDQIPPEPEEKPKRHLSVGHSEETIKQLATYLVKGFTNKRGSLPALVSSTDGNAINQLIFLFTGNRDYSFDGPYNLTWNAERVYLKLLVKLVHNLNELATSSHAVDEGRADYISKKYIKCHLKGGVWPKVAEAFENIKSEASIRNADYKKNYKDTEAPTNKKRLRDMKLIADLWLKCKDGIDF